MGLNLQKADTVILYDSDWNPSINDQAIARSFRFAQQNPVLVFRFGTNTEYDDRIVKRLDGKKLINDFSINSGNFPPLLMILAPCLTYDHFCLLTGQFDLTGMCGKKEADIQRYSTCTNDELLEEALKKMRRLTRNSEEEVLHAKSMHEFVLEDKVATTDETINDALTAIRDQDMLDEFRAIDHQRLAHMEQQFRKYNLIVGGKMPPYLLSAAPDWLTPELWEYPCIVDWLKKVEPSPGQKTAADLVVESVGLSGLPVEGEATLSADDDAGDEAVEDGDGDDGDDDDEAGEDGDDGDEAGEDGDGDDMDVDKDVESTSWTGTRLLFDPPPTGQARPPIRHRWVFNDLIAMPLPQWIDINDTLHQSDVRIYLDAIHALTLIPTDEPASVLLSTKQSTLQVVNDYRKKRNFALIANDAWVEGKPLAAAEGSLEAEFNDMETNEINASARSGRTVHRYNTTDCGNSYLNDNFNVCNDMTKTRR